MIRLQKVMADRGVASRRYAETLISEGRVRVDGEVITTLGTRVAPDARIEVDGRPVAPPSPHRYILLNKPVGIVSSANDELGRRTVVDHIGSRERLYPVGRLDTDSEGLLLLTNDGTWAERVLHPRYGHEREYDVAVEGDLTDEALARLQRGVPLEEGLARAVRVLVRSRSHGRSRISIVLLTGWKRQVRRMCLAVGLKVGRLVRVRMGPLELGRLRPGEFRDLTNKEIASMTFNSPKAEAVRPTAPARGETPARRDGVPRRPGSSRARAEGPRRQWSGERAVQAGRPTRERGPRAAAGPTARPQAGRFAPRSRSTHVAAGRAAPRRGSRRT
ncbi:MAG TPA: pseudouridine synthase [Candidatus Limnocylindria bacterium]|nr:pseudouridine synthase [Candidatus Limnocylindria bacterium]